MVEGRDHCKALRLGLPVLLLATLVVGQWPSIQLERTLLVRRGLTADIDLAISGVDNPQLTHCSFRQVPRTAHLSCGNLRPSSIQCDSPGPLVYQHHGCSSTRELIYLQLLASKNGSDADEREYEHHARFFSLEVIIEDYNSRLVYLEATTRPSEGYEYTQLTPIFPPEWVGKCYYRIVCSILPTAEIQGMVSSPLPCGYVPREPFFLLENAQHNRSVLFEITGTSANMPSKLRVLLFANSTHTLPLELPHTYLQVLQFSHTPVSADLLPCPHYYRQCVYVFPVLPVGAFIPSYSPANLHSNHTKFTSEDVADGIVTFVPSEDPYRMLATTITDTYKYAIYDYAGHKLAQSAVEVSVLSRDWDYPSLRFVASPQVQWGGNFSLNDNHMQFYIPPNSYCLENTYIGLLQSPIHGSWSFAEGRSLTINETFPHTLLQNRTLNYRHNGDESAVADGTIWSVTCDGKSFPLHMSLLIIPERREWSLNTIVQPSTLITFCGRAVPLLLDTPVYANQGLHFDVNVSEGAIVRWNSTNLLSNYPQPPYITSDNLVFKETVTQFSIEEVQQNVIWYMPICSAVNPIRLRVHMPGQATVATILLQVLYSTVSIENFFLVSSSRGLLKIVKNQPLPVASTETPVYITTSFLYTHTHHAKTTSPSAITYRVLKAPQHGHVCLSSTATNDCMQSLRDFTQADVDAYKIVYKPNEDSHILPRGNDSFTFELRYWNFGLVRPFTTMFRTFRAELEPLVLSEEQLWMEHGGTKTIPLRFFRYPYMQLQRMAEFQIVTLPQHGKLVERNQESEIVNGSTYTFEQLKRNRLQYRPLRESLYCSDSFTFVAFNSTHNVSKTILIAIRQTYYNKLGLWGAVKSVHAQDNFVFTSQDFRVLSDFCPQFVHLTQHREPEFGLLRLYQPSLRTFIQLGSGSTFTAKDVSDGRLWYTANSRFNSSYNSVANVSGSLSDTLIFNLSDPKNSGITTHRISYGFSVTFLQPREPIHIHTVFNIRDVFVLSWIPERGKFGYVFRPNDISVQSTPNLHERNISVKILIKDTPKRGWIRKGRQPVTEFYLHQLQEGGIHYMPTDWWIWVTSSDAFTISILLETNNASFFVSTVYNHSMVLLWNWVDPTPSSYRVRESAPLVQLTFRRHVDNGSCPNYESTVSLGVSPHSNATLSTNCSSEWEGDACIDSLEFSFPPGVCSQTVTVELGQDQEFEGREQLLLYIVNCTNCTSNVSLAHPVEIIIDDTDDYAYVDVVTRAESAPYGCSREINVREQVGKMTFGLTRTGNLEREVNVSCSTRSDTATENNDFEHLLHHDFIVTFAPNQTYGRCAVGIYDDIIYERKERFYVYVKAVGGLVKSALAVTPLCVYIVYDPNDAPLVSFQPRPLIIREGEGLSFSILRRGVNLHLSTRVCYQVMRNEMFTTATPNEDFTLANEDGSNRDTLCVTFAPNNTEAQCSVIAYQDNLLEGTEFVFLELLPVPQFGELGRPAVLNITILDGTEPARIGLSNTTFNIDEGEGLLRFPIIRRGSINRVNTVLCKLKPINTTVQTTDRTTADFIVPHRPEMVTFQPFNTTQYCSMWLNDDDVYEGVEALYLELDYTPLDTGVQIIASKQTATIFIHDDDDEPKVWFSSTNYTVQEPLSNFEVDKSWASLTLRRGGDSSCSFTVSYTTLGDSARAGENYISVNGTVRFEPGKETHSIAIALLASEASSQVSFKVRLSTDVTTPPTHTADCRPVTVEPDETSVVIVNTPRTGVLFPDRPVVVSLLPDGSYSSGTSLYYNTPAVCVDPCDPDFEAVSGVSYTAYCRDQQIDSGSTKYTWYISPSDEVLDYRAVQQATIFTTFDGKVLEPVYLNRSTYIRCSSQAVTALGTQGGTRLSRGAHLSLSSLSSDTCNSVSSFFELYKSDGFTGHPEELLRLTVVLKHHDNYVPLISSRPFDFSSTDLFQLLLTHPYSRDQHSCSNLVESGPQKASLLFPLLDSDARPSPSLPSSTRATKSRLLYQHFNSSKCRWEFHAWLPLSLLTSRNICNAQLSEEGQTLQLTLPLSYAYVHIHHDGGIAALPPDSYNDRVRASWPSGHKLSIPFDTYPRTANGNVRDTSTHIYPIMTRLSRGLLTVFFYSVTTAAVPIIRVQVVRVGGATSSGRLLYSSRSSLSQSTYASSDVSSSTMVRQAWMLEGVPSDEDEPISLHLWRRCSGSCASSPLVFSWFIATTDTLEPRIAPQMTGVVRVSDGHSSMEADIWLQPYFRLRVNHTLRLESVTLYLCADSEDNTTCTYSQIWTIQHRDEKTPVAAGFDMELVNKTSRSFNFTFKDEPLHQLALTGLFQLEIKCGILNMLEDPNVTESPIPPLVLYFHLPELDESPATASGVSHNVALLASSITIFLTATALVVVVLVAVGLHCRWQVKHKRNTSPAAVEERETDGNSEQQEENAGHSAATLKRSSSTTCFPTVEKSKTNVQQIPPRMLRSTTSQMTGQIDKDSFLSKSLPNLLLMSGKEGKLCRKRQLHKNVRVKAIYSLQASLDKKRGKGGRGGSGKEVEGVATVVAVQGSNNRRDALKRDKETTEMTEEAGRGMRNIQACVIKNNLHASPVQVRVRPLTGEVDPAALSTSELTPATVSKPEPTPATEP